MKYLLISIVVVALMSSCAKEVAIPEEDASVEEDFFLRFDIVDNVYDPENQTTYSVEAMQIGTGSVVFVDAYRSKHKYPYFSYGMPPTDSLDIIGAISFESKSSFGFEVQTVDIEFVVREAISNLSSISDSTYVYTNIEKLYDQLITHDFGQKNLFGNGDRSSIFVTIPEETVEGEDTYHRLPTSNGFYFSHEDLDLTEIMLDSDQEIILVHGSFVVELKQLSCGFYSSHLITDAEFSLKLK